MELQIGDRIEWEGELRTTFLYLLEYVGNNEGIVLKAGEQAIYKTGETTLLYSTHIENCGWKFVGNFSKDRSVTNLYDLLKD